MTALGRSRRVYTRAPSKHVRYAPTAAGSNGGVKWRKVPIAILPCERRVGLSRRAD